MSKLCPITGKKLVSAANPVVSKSTEAIIKITLYNEVHEFENKALAKMFLLECMANSEGSEQQRYTKAYVRVSKGETEVDDQ